MFKLLFLTVALLSTSSFALSEACENQKGALKSLKKKCRSLKANNKAKFKKCAKKYKKKLAAFKTGCADNNLDAQVKQWSNLVKRCKGKKEFSLCHLLKEVGHFVL
jgi:hypothetical protein